MKRDMDLARQILLGLEEDPEADGGRPSNVEIEGSTPEQVTYHVVLLEQAGLINAIVKGFDDHLDAVPQGLTWAGHDFLDLSRKPERWEAAKKYATEKAGGLSLEVLKSVLAQLAAQAVSGFAGLPTAH